MKHEYARFESECMQRLAACRVVLDVGGGSRFQKGMSQYKDLFQQVDYKTFDVSSDFSPDLVGDIHAIPLPDESVDGIICRSVLEHVDHPGIAIQEMYRILKPGGLLFIQVPSIYPYHARTGHGAYPDYWRFFESTMRLLLKDFAHVEIKKQGGWFYAMLLFLPWQVKLRPVLEPVANAFDRLFGTTKKTTTAMLACFANK